MEPEYEITNDATRFDVELIHRFLASSYWAPGVPRAVVEKSIRNSLGFAAMFGREQVGFARVTTDYATIAIIGDVFVAPAHRGRGVSKLLMGAIISHPELQGLRRCCSRCVMRTGSTRGRAAIPQYRREAEFRAARESGRLASQGARAGARSDILFRS